MHPSCFERQPCLVRQQISPGTLRSINPFKALRAIHDANFNGRFQAVIADAAGRGGGGSGQEENSRGRTTTDRGRGRGDTPNRGGRGGRGRGWRGGRGRPRRVADGRGRDDEQSDGGIDEGFVIIGRVERPSLAQDGAEVAVEPGTVGVSSPSPLSLLSSGAAVTTADSSVPADPLDGSRFWIEASGIDDLDQEEDEEGEMEGEDGEDDDDEPQSPEELLKNMRLQGFSLLEVVDAPTVAAAEAGGPGAVAAEGAAVAAAIAAAVAAAEASDAAASPPSLPPTAASTRGGNAEALSDLRDTFIATMKPPVLPPWFLGQVEVVAAPAAASGGQGKRGKGKAGGGGASGRGTVLRTTQAVAPGELLAVSLPLAICYCRRGTTPENEDLADAMMQSEAAGSGGSAAAVAAGTTAGRLTTGEPLVVTSNFPGLTDLQQSLLGCLWSGHGALPVQPTRGSGGGETSSEGGGAASGVRRAFLELVARSAADSSAPRSAPLVAAPDLYRLVNLNCLGEDFQDLALCELRGEAPQGHVALWPEAAFTSHSCAPNATAYAVGDRLVVRAAAEIPKGGEVSLNWLGSLLTAPLEVRRRELQQQYGFTCGCVRCTAETRYAGTPLGALVESTHVQCQELSARIDAAIELGDGDAVVEARTELLEVQARVEDALRNSSPKANAKTRRWLQASVYDLYDLISLCADDLAAAEAQLAQNNGDADSIEADGSDGQADRGSRPAQRPHPTAPTVETESLAQCSRIVEAVMPGSDSNALLTAELALRCLQRFGPKHEEYRQARAALVRAYRARYGNVGPEVMELLVAARLAAEAREEEGEEDDGDAEEGEEEVVALRGP